MRWFRAAIFLTLFIFGEMQDNSETMLDSKKDDMMSGATIANFKGDRTEPIDINGGGTTTDQKLTRNYIAKNETAILINTGVSVEVRLTANRTSAFATGTTLGGYFFVYTRTIFYWGKSENSVAGTKIEGKNGTGLEVSILYYNTKYRSFFNATNYRDGVFETRIRVDVTSDENNSKFDNFTKQMQSIKNNGSVETKLKEDNSWYLDYPDTTYYAYAGSLKNASTGKTKPCVITVVPEVVLNISRSQFEKTFLQMKDSKGDQLITKQKTYSSKDHYIIHNTNKALVKYPYFVNNLFPITFISKDGYRENNATKQSSTK